ncbi:hypothetical protein [Streptomyces sp. NPDC020965]|uniref:hypothetical protein n=1 Tax=Streptomyces sp. NPDC020965 TaxID=3365105 RepID=UPI0037B5D12F
MITLKFALPDVVDVATHTMSAPLHSLRLTYDECQNEEAVRPCLWWVRDGNGTYLIGNSTSKGGPGNAFAEGYGPGGDDASRILGGDSRVIESLPLNDTSTGECLYAELIRAQVDGHNTLTLTRSRGAVEIRSFAAAVPIAPHGLTTYTRGIVDLAVSKGLRLSWDTDRSSHLLSLTSPGPHGARGYVRVGARSGKVLRAALECPSEQGVTHVRVEGTNRVRALLAGLSPSACVPGCAAPDVAACLVRARQK